jgi:hypothetical protein
MDACFERHLASLEATWPEGQRGWELAARLRVLPLAFDATAFFALRRDGAVVSVDYEDGAVQVWDDVRTRDVMIAQGARVYPELKTMLPERTTASQVCRGCEGTGRPRHEGKAVPDNVVCGCGGLGWIPERWPPK